MINVRLNLMLERESQSEDLDWGRVGRLLGLEESKDSARPVEEWSASLLHDASNRSSIVASIVAARENARQVREQISSEMWEQLNRLFHAVRRSSPDVWSAHDFLQSVKDSAHLFQGITDSTMTHGEGWQFIQAGRFMERAVAVSTLVGAHFREFLRPGQPAAERVYLEWIGLLRSCTAFEAYCKVYTADVRPERVAEFLILHPSFPHSVRFSAEALERAIQEIGREARSRRSARIERMAGRLRATIGFGQIDEIMSGGLEPYLAELLRQCGQVHSSLYQTYVSYPIEAALEA